MTDKDKKVEVDFNEALRRIAHTPKSVIDTKKERSTEAVLPIQCSTDKVEFKNKKS